MSLSVLPANNQPNRTFECIIPINEVNRNFRFFFYWNEEAQYWQYNLFDLDREEGKQQVLCGEPVYTMDYPYNNILKSYVYEDIGSLYVINQSGDTSRSTPNSVQLGEDFLVIWGDTPDVQQLA